MKKTRLLPAVAVLMLLALVLSLTSCQVNWFGETRDVPWYFIAIPVVLVGIIGYVILMTRTYICPHCQTEFKPKPYHVYVTVHYLNKRIAKCPHCGKKSFCRVKR